MPNSYAGSIPAPHRRRARARIGLRAAAIAFAMAGLFGGAAFGQRERAQTVAPEILRSVFPGAERAGEISGQPPSAPVFRGQEIVGYLFSTREVVGSVGFSGQPIDILVGLGRDGRISGAFLRAHNEPILVIGIPHQRLRDYVAGFRGIDVRRRLDLAEARAPGSGLPDAISGASISSLVIRDAILRSARAVGRARGLFDGGADARLDRESYTPAGWRELAAEGSLVTLRLTQGDVAQAFLERGARLAEATGAAGASDDLFIELHAGLITPPRVGQNLMGQIAFNRLLADMGPKDQAILIAASGLYSFKGTGFVRSGLFDRVQLVQNEKTIRLTRDGYRNIERVAVDDAPPLREIGVFAIPSDTGFDPLAPWRIELLVGRETVQGGFVHVGFDLRYALPGRYRLPALGSALGGGAEPSAAAVPSLAASLDTPLWRRIWQERTGRIAILSVMLVVLTGILVFQDSVARRRPLYRALRLGFLAVTLVWLGWYAGVQLSVINVITFAHSLLTGFRWEFFLLEPLIFVLWSYVALAMLFWGRGVFCGWLCPFGALQELLNEGARWLRLPQVTVPFGLHERLWPIKYVIFLGLFAVSLHSTNLAVLGAEVEPFKTAISLGFVRHWPFVLYALVLLVAGLFVERFFCRYLCPLGAALAIPARLRMFEWLKRKHQCGRECNICAVRCTVQAIHPNGAINPNECIHCLNCQTLYYDDRTCPPLIARRKRREERAARLAAQGSTEAAT